jgi:hypothetical protein
MREAAKVYKSWMAKDVNRDGRVLLTTNVDSEQRWRGQIRHLAVIKSLQLFGFLHVDLQKSRDPSRALRVLNKKQLGDLNATSKDWVEEFRKHVWMDSEDVVFEIPPSPSLYGINTYKDLNAFAHLAALNPSPDLVKLYKAVLPGYDVDLDHSIDNLVQMLYRTSLRIPELKNPVLLIVTHKATSDLLAKKLKLEPFAFSKAPVLKILTPVSTRDAEERRQAASLGGKNSRKYRPEDLKVVRSLREKIARLKSKAATPEVVRLLRAAEVQLEQLKGKYGHENH